MKWGLDFIRPINLPSSLGHKWILIATNYFTKLIEVVVLKEANESLVLIFYEDIIARFGIPKSIISDNDLAFVGMRVTKWALKNNIFFSTSSNYYTQGNQKVVY